MRHKYRSLKNGNQQIPYLISNFDWHFLLLLSVNTKGMKKSHPCVIFLYIHISQYHVLSLVLGFIRKYVNIIFQMLNQFASNKMKIIKLYSNDSAYLFQPSQVFFPKRNSTYQIKMIKYVSVDPYIEFYSFIIEIILH